MKYFINKSKEKTYFKIPFDVTTPAQLLKISYSYQRFLTENNLVKEINIIDLGLEAPNGEYIGWSGSDRSTIEISDCNSSNGYKNTEIKMGTWNIIIGAYKVADDGVEVSFDIDSTPKKRTLLFGDTHIHTNGSDGNLSLDEVATRATMNGMDYIIITDHNNFAQNSYIKNYNNLTVIAGTELTHYNGHIGLIGVNKPFKENFLHNDKTQLIQKLIYAKEQGAIISINHPCCKYCGFKWGLDDVPFDALEVWNGVMTEHNEDAIKLWHDLLLQGKKIVILAGSDFHRAELLYDIGMPCTAVFAQSKQKTDILDALYNGNSYLAYSKTAPIIDCEFLGETVDINSILSITFSNLNIGDIIKIIYNDKCEEILVSKNSLIQEINLDKKGFIRFEVLRKYLSLENYSVASISNAIYVE